jgi:sugar phosphate isomerase/epimerase
VSLAASAAGLVSGCSRPAIETSAAQSRRGPFTRPLGAQLYTVRRILPERARETLVAIAEIGYTEVELLQGDRERLLPLLKQAGLKPVSMHLNAGLLLAPERATGTIEEITARAAEAGLRYLVMPYVARDSRGGLDMYKSLAEKLNRAGQVAKSAGLGFCYHNHAFEFEPMGDSTPLETLMTNSDPALVALELDVFWVSVPGKDPVELLRTYSGRVPLVHLKDKAAETPRIYNESVPPESFREAGSGSLDFAAILRAGEQAGVQHYFVEQDHTSGDPVDSLRQSYRYLRSLEL